jgi:hypothetical protein
VSSGRVERPSMERRPSSIAGGKSPLEPRREYAPSNSSEGLAVQEECQHRLLGYFWEWMGENV